MPPARSSCFAMTVLALAVLAGCLPFCPPPHVDREEFDLPGFGNMVVFTLPDATVTCPIPYFPRYSPRSVLNNSRQLVLNAPTAGPCTLCDHALLAQDGLLDTTTDIRADAEDINDAGLIALTISEGGDPRAAIWERNVVTSLPIEGRGNRSTAIALDEAGAVLGTIQHLVEDCLAEGCPRLVARWERVDGTWTINPLFELTHFAESITGMNDRGQVTGMMATVLDSLYDYSLHPFIWADGTMSLLPTFGEGEEYYSSVSDINDAGWVVGALDLPASTDMASPAHHAVLWRDGEVADLGTLGGRNSAAQAVNNLGQVVGAAHASAEIAHAFLWQDGTMRDLNELIPAELGITLAGAIDISDVGEILAVTSDDRVVLLRPEGRSVGTGMLSPLTGR